MHVVRPFDPGSLYGLAYGVRHAVDMRATADVFSRHRLAKGGSDRQRRALTWHGLMLADAEHDVMRAHDALGAARKHTRNFTDQLLRRPSQMPRQQPDESLGEIAAGKIRSEERRVGKECRSRRWREE